MNGDHFQEVDVIINSKFGEHHLTFSSLTEATKEFLNRLSSEERFDLLHLFCIGCGGDKPCTCMRDE